MSVLFHHAWANAEACVNVCPLQFIVEAVRQVQVTSRV